MNLLKETLDKLANSNHVPSDIKFIGSVSGYSCTWEEFQKLANIEYDSGYGSQIVASDLIIIFSDNSWLERREYDGSEWWKHIICPKISSNLKSINSLVMNNYDETLEEIHNPTIYEED